MYDPGPESQSNQCISLHRNENLFANQAFLKKFLSEAIKDVPLNSYPDSTSYELRQAIGKYVNCSPDQIYVGNGADGVLADIFSLLRDKYDEIGLQELTYQVYPYLCQRYKFKQKQVNETDQVWVLDSPNSINGETFDFKSIKKFPDYLIWDNVYGEFDTANQKFDLREEKLIRVHSFSKYFSLASLRVGYCISNPNFISRLLERKDIFNVNSIAQKAAIRALDNVEYFSSLVPEMLEAKKALANKLKNIGFTINLGRANFIWVTHPNYDMKHLQMELAKAGILVRNFQRTNLENYLRITIPPENIGNIFIEHVGKILSKEL